jgi:hypothetical protein
MPPITVSAMDSQRGCTNVPSQRGKNPKTPMPSIIVEMRALRVFIGALNIFAEGRKAAAASVVAAFRMCA